MPTPALTAAASPGRRAALLAALPATRFRALTPRLAGAVLTLVLFATLALLAASAGHRPSAPALSPATGDMATYARIVGRMHAGQGYYAAAHAELTSGGFGTRSVFNWRLPTLAWLTSRLPSLAVASFLLGLGALAALLAAARMVAASAGRATAYGALAALIASLIACVIPAAVLFSEVVAGVLILASASAYGLKRPAAGFVLALAALFIRELAAPYVVVCGLLALHERRLAEAGAWLAGLAAFAVYFFWHSGMVHAELAAGGLAYPEGWLQFGGLGFILATAQFNGALLAAPLWLTALLLPLSLLGLFAWRGPAGARVALAVAFYLLLFTAVGKPFNTYWGALYTPLMMLGLAFAPAALADLITAARGRAPSATAGPA